MREADAPETVRSRADHPVRASTELSWQVRDALLHLHDLPHLQTHPLIRHVPGASVVRGADLSKGKKLQRALLDAIESLRTDAPPQSRAERAHLILSLRYREVLGAAEVQRRLGVSPSEYHRAHGRSLAAVTSVLVERWRIVEPREEPPSLNLLPPPADASPPTNLPLALSSFIGRERDIDELTVRLSSPTDSRLVTLLGTGGSGKSRLALEVARAVAPAFPDGTWWVELASLSDPPLVPSAVARAVGVPETPDEALPQTIARVLTPRRSLLVLDNCEHVLDAVAALAEAILRAAPGVRILATSREGLGIGGEMLWRVPSLPTPPDAAMVRYGDAAKAGHLAASPRPRVPAAEVGEVEGYDAIRLFVERARDAQTDFALTAHNVAAVVGICRQLDGIPLAIELAAARTRAMSAEQIAARLDDRFRLLIGGSRTSLPRQQTLRASINWSYELLSESEPVVFQRLAVFAGGFTLEAAEAVCGDGGQGTGDGDRGTGDRERHLDPPVPCPPFAVPRDEVLGLLARLVEKSLVVAEPGEDGAKRFRLPETLREYAREKLAASGEAESVARRHAAAYLAMAQAAEPELHLRDQVAWLDRLEREHANLRAALGWLGARDQWVDALRLATALRWFWIVRGHYAEGRARLSEALARAEDSADVALRFWALHGLWYLASRQGDIPATQRYWDAFMGIAIDAGDRRLFVEALALSGTMLRDLAPDLAEGELREALALARELDLRAQMGPILVDLGVVTAFLGNLAGAEGSFDEGLAILRETGDVARLAFGLNLACMIGDLRGDYWRVRALAEEYGPLARALGDRSGQANCCRYLAGVAWWEGDAVGAEALLTQALAFYRGVDDRYGVAWAAAALSRARGARGDLEQARELAGEGLALARGMNEHLLIRTLRAAGDAALANGAVGTASACYREGLALLPERWVGMWRLALIEGLAKVAAAEGRPARALRLAGAAAADLARLGVTASPIDQEWLNRALAPAREALPDAEEAAASADGAAMTLAQATAYALEDETT